MCVQNRTWASCNRGALFHVLACILAVLAATSRTISQYSISTEQHRSSLHTRFHNHPQDTMVSKVTDVPWTLFRSNVYDVEAELDRERCSATSRPRRTRTHVHDGHHGQRAPRPRPALCTSTQTTDFDSRPTSSAPPRPPPRAARPRSSLRVPLALTLSGEWTWTCRWEPPGYILMLILASIHRAPKLFPTRSRNRKPRSRVSAP